VLSFLDQNVAGFNLPKLQAVLGIGIWKERTRVHGVRLPASPLCDSKNPSETTHGEGAHGYDYLRRCSEASKKALLWIMTAKKGTENMHLFFCSFGGLVTRTGLLSCLVYHLVEILCSQCGDRAGSACIKPFLSFVIPYSSHPPKGLFIQKNKLVFDDFEKTPVNIAWSCFVCGCKGTAHKDWFKMVPKYWLGD